MNDKQMKKLEKKDGGMNMFKNMKKRLTNEKGLTLVELLAVIVILGIVAAIAIPAIGNIITNSKFNAVKADAINVINAGQMYYLDTPGGNENEKISDTEKVDTRERISVGDLKALGYLETIGDIPEGATVSIGPGHTLTTEAISFAKDKSIEFKSATIEQINDFGTKGSQVTGTAEIGN